MQTPIILLHYTDNDFPYYALLAAQRSNPNEKIYFLHGTNYSFPMPENIESNRIETFYNSVQPIKESYKHYSPNGFEFEYRCIERWFIINEFAKRKNITSFLYLDSDVLLFCPTGYFKDICQNASLSISKGKSPQYMYIRDVSTLDSFCKYILNVYSNQTFFETTFLSSVTSNEGISDMVFFQFYIKEKNLEVAELTDVVDKVTFDNNINYSDGFEMEPKSGLKKIFWESKLPHGRLIGGDKIRFAGLHFQGDAKKHIHHHIPFESNSWMKLKMETALIWHRIKKRLKHGM